MAFEDLVANDEEEFYSKDDEVDDHSHKKLLNAVSQLYRRQRISAPKRNEPSHQISEFNLIKSDRKKKLGAQDLIQDLDKKSVHHQITNKIRSIHKLAKPLPKPLEKFEAEKITRDAGYNAVKQELWKWEAIIQKNRAADQLEFPLRDNEVKFERSADFLSTFTKPSELELKMAEVLKKSLLINEGKEEDESLDKMTLDEVIKRRNMVAKMRARESYRIAKAIRQNKIKSKTYHRLLKRDRIKKELKEFELLQKTDPEAALAKLERIERARAEERISLRHKNTGKWAKGVAIRAKYDTEARALLADNLRKSRELTEKIKSSMVTDSEDEGDDVDLSGMDQSKENPWVGNTSDDIASFVSGYRKFWEEKNKLKDQSVKSEENEPGKEDAANLSDSGVDSGKADNIDEIIGQKSATIKMVDDKEATAGNSIAFRKVEGRIGEKSDNEVNSDSEDILHLPEYSSPDGSDRKGTEVGECSKSGDSLAMNHEAKLVPKKNRRRKRKSINTSQGLDKSGEWSVANVQATGECSESSLLKESEETSEENKKQECRSGRKRKIAAGSDVKTRTNVFETSLIDDIEEKCGEKKRKATLDDTKRNIENLFDQVEVSIEEALPKEIKALKNKAKAKTPTNAKRERTPKLRKSNHNDLSFKKSKPSGVDESLIEVSGEGISSGLSGAQKLLERLDTTSKPKETKLPDIDPQKFIPVKIQKLKTTMPEFEEGGDSESDEDTQHLNLMEAFADDDIADEFQREKEEEEKDSKPKEVDLTLPGWGSWGGTGIEKKKRKRVVKFPKVPRKDAQKSNVIINDWKTDKFKKLLVNDLPPQYSAVAAYEASIRAPIGDNWVPQAAHMALVAPSVVTKMGAIIEPLDHSVLLKKEQEEKSLELEGAPSKKKGNRKGNRKRTGKNNRAANGEKKMFKNNGTAKGMNGSAKQKKKNNRKGKNTNVAT